MPLVFRSSFTFSQNPPGAPATMASFEPQEETSTDFGELAVMPPDASHGVSPSLSEEPQGPRSRPAREGAVPHASAHRQFGRGHWPGHHQEHPAAAQARQSLAHTPDAPSKPPAPAQPSPRAKFGHPHITPADHHDAHLREMRAKFGHPHITAGDRHDVHPSPPALASAADRHEAELREKRAKFGHPHITPAERHDAHLKERSPQGNPREVRASAWREL